MCSLLAVPVVSRGRVLGNLYLTEKDSHTGFDVDDEETLQRFATLAALAIENARLHRQVQALAITEERERIAREMHDSLAQVLGYVNTKAQAAQSLLGNEQPERAAAQLAQLAETARAAYADVREGILGLRTSLGTERDFAATLREYLQRWQEQSGIVADLDIQSVPGLSPMAEVQLLRIIQEALTNVRKHAGARHARVQLEVTDGALQFVIADDGVGFALDTLGPAGHPRFGLATMRERAEAVGGTFTIAARLGEGTTVTVSIPLAATAANREGSAHARAHR
jgi:signal transduction histidine kinase